jgi:tetratricopeptide (TPR) repeat protein
LKTNFILLLSFFIFFSCTEKNKINDKADSSQDSLSSYLSLANDFNLPLKKKQEYNQKAFAIIVEEPNDSLNRINFFKVANRYYNMNDWQGFNKIVKIVLEKSKASKDTVSIAKSFTYLGDYYGVQGVSDTAYMYYFKAEKMYLQLNDNYNLSRTRLNKALLQYNESDFLGSEIAVFKALSVIKNQKANDIIYESYNLLGLIYNELGEYENALVYQNKALESIDDKIIPIDFQPKATSLNNLGFVYQNLNNHKQAKNYFQIGLKQKDLINYKPSVFAMLLDNLAYSKFKLNEKVGVLDLFYQSLKMRDSLGLTSGIIINKIHLSEYYAYKKDTIEAVKYCKEAL